MNARTIRIIIDASKMDSPLDALNNDIIRFRKFEDIDFDIVLTHGSEILSSSDIKKIRLEVLDIGEMNQPLPRDIKLLMRKDSESFENISDISDNSQRMARFSFTKEETAISCGEKWMRIIYTAQDNREFTVSAGWIHVEENYTIELETQPESMLGIRDDIYLKAEEINSALEEIRILSAGTESKYEEISAVSENIGIIAQNFETSVSDAIARAEVAAQSAESFSSQASNKAVEAALSAEISKNSENASKFSEENSKIHADRAEAAANLIEDKKSYKGVWISATAPINPTKGDWYDIGLPVTWENITWQAGDQAIWNGISWGKIPMNGGFAIESHNIANSVSNNHIVYKPSTLSRVIMSTNLTLSYKYAFGFWVRHKGEFITGGDIFKWAATGWGAPTNYGFGIASRPTYWSIFTKFVPGLTYGWGEIRFDITSLVDGNWHWFAFVYDGEAKTADAYIDGIKQALISNSFPATMQDITIPSVPLFGIADNMKDIVFYNKGLSAEEVDRLIKYHDLPDAYMFRLRHIENKQVLDESMNNYHATLVSSEAAFKENKFINYGAMTWNASSAYAHVLGVDTLVLQAECSFEIYAKASSNISVNIGKSTTTNNNDYAANAAISTTWSKVNLTNSICDLSASNIVFKPTTSFTGTITTKIKIERLR